MGENFNQLDGVFRSKLRDYSESAPEGVWENIEGALNSRKSTKRIRSYRIAAAIAAFAIVGSSYLYLTKSNQKTTENQTVADVVRIDDKQSNNVKNAQGLDEVEVVSSRVLNADDKEQETLIAKSEPLKKETKDLNSEVLLADNIESGNRINKEEIEKITQKETRLTFHKVEPILIDPRQEKVKAILNSIPDIYNSFALTNAIESPEAESNKWSVGGDFSPLYSYRYIAETGGTNSKKY